MNNFNNLGLRKRLYGVAALIALVLMLCAGLSWRLGSIGAVALADEENSTRSTVALAEAQSAVWALRWGVANYLATTDSGAKAKVVADSPKLRGQFDQAMKQFELTGASDAERAKLTELRDAFGQYAAARLEFFRLMEADKSAEAVSMRNATLTPAGGATNKAFAELIDLQRKGVAERSARSEKALSGAQTLVLGIFGVALLATFGALALAVRSVLRQLGGDPALVTEHVRAFAEGDLSVAIDPSGAPAGSVIAALADMQVRLSQLVGQVRSAADSIATGSAQIATGNADLSHRTETQAANLQHTASSMAQMNSAISNSADTARQATELATSASAAAQEGGAVVHQVVATMDDITASSKKIVDIIGVIDGIAFQTNILALNAAVEAARAGEQGRGFAVVASEVRNLAQRSAEAAKEIKSLIGASVDKVEAGSKLVGDAGTSMSNIVAQVKHVADLIAEISASTIGQTSDIGQVSSAVTQLDQATQQNAALVEESAAAAESLTRHASRLVESVSVFKLNATAARA